MQKRQLFLYLKTGGGHLAPARSVANYLQSRYPGKVKPFLYDGFKNVNKWVRYAIEDGYRKSQANAVWVFEMLYALNKIRFIASATAALVSWFVIPHLEKIIRKENPSKIVIFHFFLIKPVLEILKKHQLKIPLVTVVTDPFTAHPIWFLEKETQFIVFSERVKNYAISKNIASSQISVYPFILGEKFTKPISGIIKKSTKESLGFQYQKKLILILGGGDGMPRGAKILKKCLKNNPLVEVAIVCGKNKSLYNKALKIKKKYNYTSLKIYGYVDFIYELINIADIVVTKCGASTFMEILISGKIPVINNYIWEQEKGNMEFVRDNLLGVYEKNTSKLPSKINNIIQNPDLYSIYEKNIKKMEIVNGTPMVSEYLIS
ncbi:MAG: MGDG synthase family glycosyltransferase [Bacteroidota bacterium]